MENSEHLALCYRCEHRARWFETNGLDQPRCECGMGSYDAATGKVKMLGSWGCYMYQPTKPLAVAPLKGEKRPIFGPAMIAGRVHPVRVPDVKAALSVDKGAYTAYWVPVKRGKSAKKKNADRDI